MDHNSNCRYVSFERLMCFILVRKRSSLNFYCVVSLVEWATFKQPTHFSFRSRGPFALGIPTPSQRKDLYCKAMHPAGTFEDNFFFSKWWDMWSFPGAHIWVSEVDKSKIWISTPKNQGSFWQNFVRWRRVWLGIWFLVVGGPQTLFSSQGICMSKSKFLITHLGGGFSFFYFHPYLGKIPILTNIFQWVVQPPTR